MKISKVYKITNTVTNDFYIGSSKNVKQRWIAHKSPSRWESCPNSTLYLDMQKYGVDKFNFQILANVEPEQLKEIEQQFIEKLQPTYNNYNAKGLGVEKQKKYQKEYHKSEKRKKTMKEYNQSDKGKEVHRKATYKYNNQLCFYSGETLTLAALRCRFIKMGVEHPTLEAKKYLLDKDL